MAVACAATAYLLQRLSADGISWTEWWWKGVGTGDCALTNLGGGARRDMLHDSFATIEARWGSMQAPMCVRC
jgi:hypothetical protein